MAQQNVSTMNIQLTMQGQQAEQGLNRIGSLVDNLKGKFDELSNGVQSLAILQLGKSLLEGLAAFSGWIDQTQKLNIQLGQMAGNLSRGAEFAKSLQEIASSTSVKLADLVSGFENLGNAGIGLNQSMDVLEQSGRLDWLFGGDGSGVKAITTEIAKMNQSLAGSANAFDLLRAKGVNAYQNLAKMLGVTAQEAEKLLKGGKVTGFQASQAIARSLNSKESKDLQAAGDTTAKRFADLAPSNWGNLTRDAAKEYYNDTIVPIGEFLTQLTLPFRSGATTLNGGNDAIRASGGQFAEAMKALSTNMENIRKVLTEDLKTGSQKILDQLTLLDQQIKLTTANDDFKDVAKLLQDKKNSLVESFVQIPLSAYETLGKQAQEIRDQIEEATKAGQGELAARLQERLKTLMPESSTAGGPVEGIAEKLQKLRAQYDKASSRFGGSELSAKFYQDQDELLKQFASNDNSPFQTLQASLKDLDEAGRRLRSFNMAPDKYIQAREELAKREQKLVADYERSVMDPVLTEGERFAKAIAEARAAIETAASEGDTVGGTAAEKRLMNLIQGKVAGVKGGSGDVSKFFAGRAEAGSVDAWRTISKWQRSGMVSRDTTEQRLVRAAELQLKENQRASKELEEIKKVLNSKNPPPALVTIGWAGGPSKTKQ